MKFLNIILIFILIGSSLFGYSQTNFLRTEAGNFFKTEAGNFYNPYTAPLVAYDTTNWYFANDGDNSGSGHHPDTAKQTITELVMPLKLKSVVILVSAY